MQQTRLNDLISAAVTQLELLFNNPWRRMSLNIISLLMGFFMGPAIVSTGGQEGVWDLTGAAILLVCTELSSKWVYGRNNHMRRSLFMGMLNLFKIGLTYSLFLESHKLNT